MSRESGLIFSARKTDRSEADRSVLLFSAPDRTSGAGYRLLYLYT